MGSTLKANILKVGIALVLVNILCFAVYRYVKLHAAYSSADAKPQLEERVKLLEKRVEDLEKKSK